MLLMLVIADVSESKTKVIARSEQPYTGSIYGQEGGKEL